METKNLKKVLKDTKRIIKHHNELTVAKGEHFNLFSVLKIETRENNTHSAFLAELLNPNGSHRMGDVFLKHFITTIEHSNSFETKNAKVKVERSIGTVDLKDKIGEEKSQASGGRIDIYLKDINGNIISIENKIHALDQKAQIQRYYNHKTTKNTVYYLTLKGKDPIKESRLELKSGVAFNNISYRDDIIKWLELCLKEVPNFTSLRESINQYILLIKKLAHILNTEEQKALSDTIVENLEESQHIANNYQNVINSIREAFRKELISRLKKHLEEELYEVKSDLPVFQNYSKIWIHFKNRQEVPFSYCVEPFSASGNSNGAMFVGLYGHDHSIAKTIPDPNRLNDVWQHIHWITTTENNQVHLNSPSLLKTLYDSKTNQYNNLIAEAFDQIVEFIEETNKYILN
jgi:hypothetical protein